MASNLFPTNKILSRQEKEQLLGQKGLVVWMTGLSGSGKTTLAVALEKALYNQGKLTQVLDGDNIRTGINNNLGFGETDRIENIRRIAEVSKLFVECGVITICCFISPTNFMRNQAREIIGAENFLEVYVNAPLQVCEERDVKGLYAKARRGDITDFTGIHAPFEAPQNPEVELNTGTCIVPAAVEVLLEKIEGKSKSA